MEQPEVAGVSTKQEMDAPSAYLTFRRKGGEPIATYLVSLLLRPQMIDINGKVYSLELRNCLDYKPYSLTLIEFRYDRYIGTEVAKNYSSRVRLRDSDRGEDREVLIRMNEPLRYQGETFYQADFDKTTEKGTILQVVRNPGWLLPYISCFPGHGWHDDALRDHAGELPSAEGRAMTIRSVGPVAAAVLLSGVYFVAKAIPPAEGELHLRLAGSASGGRRRPGQTARHCRPRLAHPHQRPAGVSGRRRG